MSAALSGLFMDPISAQAGAAAVQAFAALVLVGVTVYYARQTHQQVSASQHAVAEMQRAREVEAQALEGVRRQAEASERQAEEAATVVDEMRADRELELAPYVVPGHSWEWWRNIGRGPALNCQCAWCRWQPGGNQYTVSVIVDLAAGCDERDARQARDDETILGRAVDIAIKILDGMPVVDQTRQTTAAIVCEDQLGNKYRFRLGEPVPDVRRRGDRGPEPAWCGWDRGN